MDVKEFGQFLKSLRNAKGLTLDELGALTGYSNPYLSQIENGRKRSMPSPELLKKLEDPLGVPYEQLMIKAGHARELSNLSLTKFAYGTGSLNSQISMMWGVIELTLMDEEERFYTQFGEEMDKIEEKARRVFGSDFSLTPANLLGEISKIDWKTEPFSQKHEEVFDILSGVNSLAMAEYHATKDLDNVLIQEAAQYRGNPLTDEDRQLIKLFLDTLFKKRIEEMVPIDQLFR